jgi:hypothetical protein
MLYSARLGGRGTLRLPRASAALSSKGKAAAAAAAAAADDTPAPARPVPADLSTRSDSDVLAQLRDGSARVDTLEAHLRGDHVRAIRLRRAYFGEWMDKSRGERYGFWGGGVYHYFGC